MPTKSNMTGYPYANSRPPGYEITPGPRSYEEFMAANSGPEVVSDEAVAHDAGRVAADHTVAIDDTPTEEISVIAEIDDDTYFETMRVLGPASEPKDVSETTVGYRPAETTHTPGLIGPGGEYELSSGE